MAGEVLSQSEVESLLAALDPDSAPRRPVADLPQSTFGGNIVVYDFKRPERVSKEQMRAFQALHEGFSREFGASLSGMLRSIVEVKLISVDQLTYNEFVYSLENPTCFNLLHSQGMDGHLILDLNPSIIYPIVDRLLGGGKTTRSNVPTRPLTEIELRLVGRFTKLALSALESAWVNICELQLSVVQVESNPQLIQIVPPNEVIVLISFEITMGEIRGIMNLCIPFNTIEPLVGKLSSDTWSAYTKRVADKRQQTNLEASLSRAKVSLLVRLAETQLSGKDLVNLAVGDIIMTETGVQQGVKVLVEGRPSYWAAPGQYKGHKAIRLTAPIVHPKEIVNQKLKDHPESH